MFSNQIHKSEQGQKNLNASDDYLGEIDKNISRFAIRDLIQKRGR